jgi:hypothetical protein
MTDWISDAESGSSVRAKLNLIKGKGTVEHITSGASPITADPNVDITYITTGGTNDTENVTLGKFTLDGNGFNHEKNGSIHTLIVEHRTSSGDRVHVFTGSIGDPIEAADDVGNIIAVSDSSGGKLNSAGASISFVWLDYEWYVALENGANSTNWINKRYPSSDGSDGQVSTWRSGTVGFETPVGGGGTGLTDGTSDGNAIASDVVYNGLINNTSPTCVTGSDPVVASSAFREIKIVTDNSGGTQIFSIDDQALSADLIGNRILILMLNRQGSDIASLTPGNIKAADGADIASITFDATGQYLLIENYDGAHWRVVRGSATVTPA